MSSQLVKAFIGSDYESVDVSLAQKIQKFTDDNNLVIEHISYSIGKRGYALVVFKENDNE